MTTPKKTRHHYVPSGLSKNFCVEEKRFYYYDVEQNTINPSSPKDAFRIKKFHSIVKDDGTEDHNLVEDIFMEHEGKACAYIGNLLRGEKLDNERKGWVASFWALQLLRTPLVRAGMEVFLKETFRTTTKVLDQSGRLPPMPEVLRPYGDSITELFDNGAIDLKITLPQVTMSSIVAWHPVTELLCHMNWCVLKSSGENYFLLSDNPCAILDPDFEHHNMGIGVGHPNIEVTLPIDKNHCLLASWNNIPETMHVGREQVQAINKRTALFGERFFAHPLQSKKIMNFLMPYAKAKPTMLSQSIPTQEGGKKGYFIISRQNLFTEEPYRRLYRALPLIFPEAIRKFAG